ncbi:MAG: hypothetical protein GTO16_13815 [Candidatus Aminicenantes bacterium]|nr:hypothetical protein [Candidatus Aminicenantes bacterium]
MQPTVELRGTQAIVNNVKRLNEKIQKELRNVVLRTAYVVEGDAKRMCPVDTGRLRGSLSVNWSNSGLTRGKTQPPATSEDGLAQPGFGTGQFLAGVGTNVEYAEYVENRRSFLWTAYWLSVNWGYFSEQLKKAMEKVK